MTFAIFSKFFQFASVYLPSYLIIMYFLYLIISLDIHIQLQSLIF